MKKLFLTMLGVCAMLCSTSCSDEEIVVASSESEAMVELTVALNDGSDASRAISDGKTVDWVYYEVFTHLKNADGTDAWKSMSALKDSTVLLGGTEGNKYANISLALVKGQSYDVVFWASKQGVYNTANLRTITVAGDGSLANDERKDAFTAVYRTSKVTGPIKETIKLTRPFAQINFGTTVDDYTFALKAGVDFGATSTEIEGTLASKIVASHGATVYDALTEKSTDDGQELTFGWTSVKTMVEGEVLKVGDVNYKYLATAYMLVPGGKESNVSDVEMEIETGLNENIILSVPTAPVQRNYRTNILGNLLTNQADFTIIVDPIYNEPDYIETVWDGKSTVKPAYDEATKTYSVGNAEELAWIANLVNGTLPAEARSEVAPAETLAGVTVKLIDDINLANQEWSPIGIGTNRFEGSIDGNGYTIHNLRITQRHGNYSQAALVGNVAGKVVFSNLTIKNATIECPDYTNDFYGAAVVGTMYGNVTFDKINVIDSYISGNNKVSALVAHDGVCSSLNINDCHVSGVKFEALNSEDGGSVGGLVGFFQGVAKKAGQSAPYGEHNVKNSTVKGCTFNVVNSTNSGKRANGQLIGGISSKEGQELYVENCSVENNTWNEKFYVDGVEVAEAGRYVSPFGNMIGGDRNDAPKGVVSINGKTYTYVADGAYEVNGDYEISNAAGLKWVADVVNATTPYTPTIFDNKVVKLMNDIDLNNQEWIPIGDDRSQRTEFHGIFDGQGYTVSNVKITKKTDRDDDNKSSYGLFGNLKGTVKNLTVTGVSISGAPKFIGALVGRMNGGLVENCHVKNSSVECNNWTIGGVVGQLNDGKISGCTIENTTVKGYAAVGGIAGIALNTGERIIEKCSVKNCTFVQNGEFGGNFDKMFGAVVGALYSGELTVNLNECVAEGNTIKGDASNELCGYVAEGDVLKVDGKQVFPYYVYDAETKTHKIYSVEGLLTVANTAIKGGEKVVLESDLDLAGVEFNGLSAFNPEPNNTFDGQGHTISNWTNNSGAADMGFIRKWVGSIKNVKFDNCHVKTGGRSGVVAGTVYADIEGVHVNNCSIEDSYWACGIIAGHYNSGSVKDCTVTNSSVKSNGATGAVVGLLNETAGTRSFTNCKVTGCTINNTGIYGAAYSGAAVVGMININNSTVKFVGCEQTGNTFLGDAHDSLHAPADSDVTIVIE